MLKRTTVLGVTLFFLLMLTGNANGQTSTPTSKPRSEQFESKNQERIEKLNILKQRIEDKKASVEARLSEVRQQKIKLYQAMMKQRMLAVIDRLDILIERLENRIAIIESSGESVELASIKIQVTEAKENLADATVKLDEIESGLDELLESDGPKTGFSIMREDVKEVRSLLTEVHKTLVQVVGDLKGLRVGNSEEATDSGNTE